MKVVLALLAAGHVALAAEQQQCGYPEPPFVPDKTPPESTKFVFRNQVSERWPAFANCPLCWFGLGSGVCSLAKRTNAGGRALGQAGFGVVHLNAQDSCQEAHTFRFALNLHSIPIPLSLLCLYRANRTPLLWSPKKPTRPLAPSMSNGVPLPTSLFLSHWPGGASHAIFT